MYGFTVRFPVDEFGLLQETVHKLNKIQMCVIAKCVAYVWAMRCPQSRT